MFDGAVMVSVVESSQTDPSSKARRNSFDRIPCGHAFKLRATFLKFNVWKPSVNVMAIRVR